MKNYTAEAYAPPYFEKNRYVRVHQGHVNSIKDSLSPNTVELFHISAPTKIQATRQAKNWIVVLNEQQVLKNKPLYKFQR